MHLLKQRAKAFRIVKPRVTYEYLGPGKRQRLPDGSIRHVVQAPAMASASAMAQRARNKITPNVTEVYMDTQEGKKK